MIFYQITNLRPKTTFYFLKKVAVAAENSVCNHLFSTYNYFNTYFYFRSDIIMTDRPSNTNFRISNIYYSQFKRFLSL